MNNKLAKKLRRFSKDKGLEAKTVKNKFKRLSKMHQKLVVKGVINDRSRDTD